MQVRLLSLALAACVAAALFASAAPASAATGALGSFEAMGLQVFSPTFSPAVSSAVSPAEATSRQRPYVEALGLAEAATVGEAIQVAVEPENGDVLVGDGTTESIYRFHADGTPAPFTALGTNVIDGAEDGGKPCGEEAASCDQTPQNALYLKASYLTPTQIAVSPVDGDIYVSQTVSRVVAAVDIFSPEGRYLGQLTGGINGSIDQVCGVAVDASGAVYVGGELGPTNGKGETPVGIDKFLPPAGGPPTNEDSTAFFPVEAPGIGKPKPCGLVAGTAASEGYLFASEEIEAQFNHLPETLKINEQTGDYTTFVEGYYGNIAVDPTTGNAIIASQADSGEAAEFDGAPATISEAEAQTPLSRTFFDSISGELPRSGSRLSVNAAGNLLVAARNPSHYAALVYGSPAVVATPLAAAATNVSGTRATLSGTVDPGGLEVSSCLFEWGATTSYDHAVTCEGAIPTDSKAHPVHVSLSGLVPNGATYHYRIAATDENGTEYSPDRSFVTAQTVVTDPASEVAISSARLNGTLRPEGLEYSACVFEYGLTTSAGYEHSLACEPAAPSIEGDFSPHPVTAALTGLQVGATYRFRLVATTSEGTRDGGTLRFTTTGPPQISEVRAHDANQTEATLEAEIDPSGFPTSYRFEWGTGTGYGHRVPADVEPFVGSGTTPVRVTARIGGLSAATVYHYRVVASSTAQSSSTTESADEQVETLDSCGLPDGRCLEMVSPKELGLVGAPGRIQFEGREVQYQASQGPGGLAYEMEAGPPDATAGTELLYLATRGAAGWSSTQLTPALTGRTEQIGVAAQMAAWLGFAPDLQCGVVATAQLLTDDPAARPIVEAGGANLYRRSPDGSYTLITEIPPAPVEPAFGSVANQFTLFGISNDCGHIVFAPRDQAHYPGVAGDGAPYEWTQSGGIQSIGWVPGATGEEAVSAEVGSQNDHYHAVSEDGSRVFFSAKRIVPGNPADSGELNKTGVFVREGGQTTRDVSASQTTTPDTGAIYQGATPSGSRVYFTANAGLTAESSAEGTDLYEYNLESETLTDLTVDREAGGAEAGGAGKSGTGSLVGVSADGSHVYLTAQGQLVPGRGGTLAENQSDETASLYEESGGVIRFVAQVSVLSNTRLTAIEQGGRTSRVSPDGRYLLFESSEPVTGYESHGAMQAYLYDAQAQGEAVVCVTCRQDGGPTATHGQALLAEETDAVYEPQTLVIRAGRPLVFFDSRDHLAASAGPGTSAGGEWNVYEWAHGQVFAITSEEAKPHVTVTFHAVKFEGASAEGEDLYFVDPSALNWENPNSRYAIWDAKIGGGFAEPPAPPSGCEPAVEGSCQGQAAPAPAVATPGSVTHSGPGNLSPAPPEQGGGHKNAKKRHHKQYHKAKQHKKKHQNAKRHRKKTHKARRHDKQRDQIKRSAARAHRSSRAGAGHGAGRHANNRGRAGR